MIKISKGINLIVILALLLAQFVTAQPAAAGHRFVSAAVTSPGAFVPGEVVVRFTSTNAKVIRTQAAALANSVDAQVVSQNGNLALLRVNSDVDVVALSAQLGSQPGVKFAEPDYIYTASVITPTSSDTLDSTPATTLTAPNGSTVSPDPMPGVSASGGGSLPGYPNDPDLVTNWGWSWVGAGIVWPNTTASAGICELDTGVDYLHPELATSVIKGYDFVNDDAIPMDDNGHGTMLAGVMAAKMNNAEGLAGITSGKVVAVKVLDSQAAGIAYNIAAGINFCAGRRDASVILVGWEGPSSNTITNALSDAINVSGKLVVATGGDDDSIDASFPASLAGTSGFTNHTLLPVIAYDLTGCRYDQANYGTWVSVVAPGANIYTTTPWDKPFYLHSENPTTWTSRYAYATGSDVAAAFVAAIAARRWGYKPTTHNSDVGLAIRDLNIAVHPDGTCWPSEMDVAHYANVAWMLERGAATAHIYDATTGLPLVGALFQVYKTAPGPLPIRVLVGSSPVYVATNGYVEVLNLPAGTGYSAAVSMPGWTTGSQFAFRHGSADGINGLHDRIFGGSQTYFGIAAIPQPGANFAVVSGWGQAMGSEDGDLNLDVFLPKAPNAADPSQVAQFMVGRNGAFVYSPVLEVNPRGTLIGFPFAMENLQWSPRDHANVETTTIVSRKAHPPLAANLALPYYPGTYYVGITDNGNTFEAGEHVRDHVLLWTYPYAYLWKGGSILAFATNSSCNNTWWYPFALTSGTGGLLAVTSPNRCTALTPYDPGFSASATP